MRKLAAVWVATLMIATGCATDSGGVVQTGPDTFMVGGQGGYFDLSGSAVKAKYVQDAARFCERRRQKMTLLGSSGKDSGFGTMAAAEVHFRCHRE